MVRVHRLTATGGDLLRIAEINTHLGTSAVHKTTLFSNSNRTRRPRAYLRGQCRGIGHLGTNCYGFGGLSIELVGRLIDVDHLENPINSLDTKYPDSL